MLFPYQYIPHKMEKLQEFVDYIFMNVWCQALNSDYDLALFEEQQELHEIMSFLFQLDLAGKLVNGAAKDFFIDVSEIFNEFKSLSESEMQEYSEIYISNNSIANACSCSPDCWPKRYSDLNPQRSDLNKRLEQFFTGLYSSGFFELARVREKINSSFDNYYEDFVRINDNGVCPFCGLMPIDSEFDPTREAYDHYLPKSRYPFNSVNLKNLAPSCNKCNSGCKRDQDPLYDKTGCRRKAFFPFSTSNANILFCLRITNRNWVSLSPEDIELELSSGLHSEEIETWKELYRIEQRYKAKCCIKGGGITWLNRVFNERQNYGLSIEAMVAAEMNSCDLEPWSNVNFLKKAFLEGCRQADLFSE